MRPLFFLLVLANLIFFAWTQGYFGAADDGREPQRLAQQLHAEQMRIVREAAAPAVTKDEMACRLIDGLNLADAGAVKAAVEAAGGAARISPLAEPPLYLVVVADLANKAAADRKAAELARFGVEQLGVVALEGGRHEIVLGSFGGEAAARELLQGLARRGIKSARVSAREQPVVKARVEARGPAAALLRQLPPLIATYAAATLGACAPE